MPIAGFLLFFGEGGNDGDGGVLSKNKFNLLNRMFVWKKKILNRLRVYALEIRKILTKKKKLNTLLTTGVIAGVFRTKDVEIREFKNGRKTVPYFLQGLHDTNRYSNIVYNINTVG